MIARAIELEAAQAAHDHGVELFSRGVQANVGMGFGVLAFGVAVGALFAVLFVVAFGRFPGVEPRALSMWLAGAAFGATTLIPFLKYPPNPPAVGLEETLRDRTGLYLVLVVLSSALAIAAVWLGRRLVPRFGGWSAALMACGAHVVAISVVLLALPDVQETPDGFPADVLYDFRLYSLGTQLVMWAAIGLVFASSVNRVLTDASATGRAVLVAGPRNP